LATSCGPPNIVNLFNKVGGFFYSTDVNLPQGGGVKLTQRTAYPWGGTIIVPIEPKNPHAFTLRLRVPAWAKSHTLSVNGRPIDTTPQNGWLNVHRR
jgi:DUF1680 family protein